MNIQKEQHNNEFRFVLPVVLLQYGLPPYE